MSLAHPSVQDAAIGVAVADNPENLNAFLKPGCAAAIWRRHPSADFQNWINNLDPSVLPQGRIVLKPEATRSIVTELCEISRTPSCPQRVHLIADIAALADIFASLMQAPYLRLRLAAVTTNACRKWPFQKTSCLKGLSPQNQVRQLQPPKFSA